MPPYIGAKSGIYVKKYRQLQKFRGERERGGEREKEGERIKQRLKDKSLDER